MSLMACAGKNAHHDVGHLDARLDPGVGELLGHLADLVFDLIFVGANVGAAFAGELLLDVGDHGPGPVATGELLRNRNRPLQSLRSVQRQHDGLEHAEPP
jgi:hypothetical protein